MSMWRHWFDPPETKCGGKLIGQRAIQIKMLNLLAARTMIESTREENNLAPVALATQEDCLVQMPHDLQ